MRKYVLMLIIVLGCLPIIAKTTYVPRYFSQININSGLEAKVDSGFDREITILSSDNRYSITVIHDSVTTERIKAIKRIKALSGWSLAFGILSGVSSVLQPIYTGMDVVRYLHKVDNACAFGLISVASRSVASSLQKVNINFVITNNTDREMVVNDLQRGLTWYILPKSLITLQVGNPEVNKLRIAYSDCTNQAVDYVKIQAGNVLEKRYLAFENDHYWYYLNQEEMEVESSFGEYTTEYNTIGYDEVEKSTYIHREITVEEFKRIKQESK